MSNRQNIQSVPLCELIWLRCFCFMAYCFAFYVAVWCGLTITTRFWCCCDAVSYLLSWLCTYFVVVFYAVVVVVAATAVFARIPNYVLHSEYQTKSEHMRVSDPFQGLSLLTYIHTHTCIAWLLYIIIHDNKKKEPVFKCVSAVLYGTSKFSSLKNVPTLNFCFDIWIHL